MKEKNSQGDRGTPNAPLDTAGVVRAVAFAGLGFTQCRILRMLWYQRVTIQDAIRHYRETSPIQEGQNKVVEGLHQRQR